MADAPCYRTVTEIEEVVHRFEECSYTPEEFVHEKHLTVAAVYFVRFDGAVAWERMRSGLRKFISHHGKNAYHETITEFWLSLVEHAIREGMPADRDVVARVNQVVRRFRDKNMIYAHFSRERLATPDAKASWLEPDLAAIPFETPLDE